MLVDGKAIAAEILAKVKDEVAAMLQPPQLTVFSCEPNFETKKYLALKEKRAVEIGIEMNVIECDKESSLQQVLFEIGEAHTTADGIIVQLPFPKRIPLSELETAIAPSHDVDALTYDGGDTDVLPPVVGAIEEIAKKYEISFKDLNVVVIGHGRLVGAPAALYLRQQGANVEVLTKETTDIASHTKTADVLVLGTGVPGLVTPEMVKEGVVVFDAGASEMNGALLGDADPEVAKKAALFSPVPGGIGPITIAVLFRNVVALAKSK